MVKLAVLFVLAATATAGAQPALTSPEPSAGAPVDDDVRHMYVAVRAGAIAISYHQDGDDDGDPAVNGSGTGWVADLEIGARLGRTEAGGYLDIWNAQPSIASQQSIAGYGMGYRGRYRVVAGLYVGGGFGFAFSTGVGVVLTADADIAYRFPKVGPMALELSAIVQGGYMPGIPLPESPAQADSMLSARLELGVVF